MSEPALFAQLRERFGEQITELEVVGSDIRLTVAPETLAKVLHFVRHEGDPPMTYPGMLTAYDTGENLVLVYRLSSLEQGQTLLVHVLLPRENPVVTSATSLWPGMNWHEREVFDMFGIHFEGHPELKRILLPDDWVGHPFRKDYVSVPSDDPLSGPQPTDPVGGSR